MSQILFVYGLSGSGKSSSARILEDAGVTVLRNVPPLLLMQSVHLLEQIAQKKIVAVYPELLCSGDVENSMRLADVLQAKSNRVVTIFLEAGEETLINRYKESRRPHPFREKTSLLEAIRFEKQVLFPLKIRAEYVLGTDDLKLGQFAERLLFASQIAPISKMELTVLSFGFKYGLPKDIDICLDVRFLKNPFFVEELKALSGLDRKVRDFVLGFEQSKAFLSKTKDLVSFLLPQYLNEGKNYLTIGVGCTGGRHRSVAIAQEIFELTLGSSNVSASCVHRDIHKDELSQNVQ